MAATTGHPSGSKLGMELGLAELLDKLNELEYQVIAPVRINGTVKLMPINQDQKPELNYVRLCNAPSEFILPCRESLFRYKSTATITSYGLKIRFPTVEGPCPVALTPECSLPRGKLAFVGIHPCMINSIKYLDRVMLGEPADPYYEARREEMLIIALECQESDQYCTCGTLGTYSIPEGYSDMSVRKEGDDFFIQATSERGSEIIGSMGSHGILRLVKKNTSINVYFGSGIKENICAGKNAPVETDTRNVDGISGEDCRPRAPGMKERYELGPLDEESIERRNASALLESCTLCSACTVTCPTCYCSDIEDKFSLMDPTNVERTRVRMSCQRRGYSAIAGGETFLKTKEARFKWRLKHKFPFSERNYKMLGCTGCGNCIAFCPARIDFREFLGRKISP